MGFSSAQYYVYNQTDFRIMHETTWIILNPLKFVKWIT